MSLSNPAYGTLPAFQRPASTGPGLGGGGFIAPPPGASQGGEPGQHPFQQSNPSLWPNPQSYQLPPQNQPVQPPWAYTQSQQSQPQNYSQLQQPYYQTQQSQSSPFIPLQQPAQHSPYRTHRPQLGQYQPQFSQQSDSTSIPPWTYGQYPPSPDIPFSAPATTSAINTSYTSSAGPARYSPYGVSLTHPPASAPAETPPWSQHLHAQQPNTQFIENSPRPTQLHHQRSQTHRQHSSSSGRIQHTEETPRYTAPLPFRGSANAPPPKKSALRRSNSQSAVDRPIPSGSQSHTPQMHRTDSTGSVFGHSGSVWQPVLPLAQIPQVPPDMPLVPSSSAPSYTLGDDVTYSPDNLAPRPRDWRADYTSKQGFSLYLPKIGRIRTDVTEYIDSIKRNMHPLLHYTPNTTPLALDLRYKLIDGHTLLFHQLGRRFNEVDLAQLAAYDPVPILRLYHPRLPWYVDIHQSHPSGVTVFDVLVQMSLQMQAPIHHRHYYNESLDSEDRAAVGKSYKERIKGRSGEGRKGVLQVDFLRDKFIFEGLIRGKQGMWEMKTRRVDSA